VDDGVQIVRMALNQEGYKVRTAGYKVRTACDELAAIEAIEAGGVDSVLLGVGMSLLDGLGRLLSHP